jgi:hypothetical protein
MRTAITGAGAVCALALSILAPQSAVAGPDAHVFSPVVEEGEREIELNMGTAKNANGTRKSAYALSVGYGVNSRWFTEIEAKWHKDPGNANSFDAWEWENRFQLTETGKYPVDVGFLFELERPEDRTEGYEYKWGALLQADLGTMVQANLNILFEKHIHAASPGPAELGYQWQVKYRYKPEFEFGAQGFGEVGAWDHWDATSKQSHIAGPAIFGKLDIGERRAIKYDAGILFGLNNGSPRTTFRMRAEYEF